MTSKQLFVTFLRIFSLIFFYYVTSIGITFYNQNFIRHFSFPLTLTLCHFVAKFMISYAIRYVLMWRETVRFVRLEWKQCLTRILPTGTSFFNDLKSVYLQFVFLALAVAGSLDIGLSNWSFEFVTISLYTMTKSSAILFILFFSILFKLERPKWTTAALVILISLGLFLFTYRSSQFSTGGFFLVLFASCLSGIRWGLTQMVMQRAEIGLSNPLDMMYHLQPFMALSILPLAVVAEGPAVALSPHFFAFELRDEHSGTFGYAMLLIFGGCILAFFMELSEFLLVRYTSSLTLAISGIFKELCTLLLAAVFKHDVISPINWIGVLLCLCGISLHAYSKFKQGRSEEAKTKENESFHMTSPETGDEFVPLMEEEEEEAEEMGGDILLSSSGQERQLPNSLNAFKAYEDNDDGDVIFKASAHGVNKS